MCYLGNCYLDLIAVFTSLITGIIMAFFFSKIFMPKKESKFYSLKYFAIIYGTYLICRSNSFLYENRTLLMLSSYLLSMILLSRDSLKKKLLVLFISYVFMIIVDFPVNHFILTKYGYTFAELDAMANEDYYLIYNILFNDYNTLAMNGLNNVFLIFLYISLMMIMKKETRHFYVWLISLVITGLVIFNCVMAYLYLSDFASVAVSIISQVITVVLLIYIIEKLSIHLKYDKSVEENKFLKEKEKMQLSYYEMMKSREDEVRKINHDIKNNLQVMYSLNDENKRIEMIEKINANLDKHYMKKYSSQEILNVILNIKFSNALSRGIDIDVSVKRKLDFMEDIDVSNLITNVLDNAIEAADKSLDKRIDFVIKKKMNYVIIECENTFNGEVELNKKKQLVTTKDGDHGYGSKIIKNVVEKYNGNLAYEIKDNKFKLTIIIEMTEK